MIEHRPDDDARAAVIERVSGFRADVVGRPAEDDDETDDRDGGAEADLAEMDGYWDEAKEREKG